jgi:hypothetical protein
MAEGELRYAIAGVVLKTSVRIWVQDLREQASTVLITMETTVPEIPDGLREQFRIVTLIELDYSPSEALRNA